MPKKKCHFHAISRVYLCLSHTYIKDNPQIVYFWTPNRIVDITYKIDFDIKGG